MFVRCCAFVTDLLLFCLRGLDLRRFALLCFRILFRMPCARRWQAAALELQVLSILVDADPDTGILRDVSTQDFLCKLILELGLKHPAQRNLDFEQFFLPFHRMYLVLVLLLVLS